METRRSNFFEWRPPSGPLEAIRGRKIGNGKYGTVYLCQGSPHVVIKEVTIDKAKSNASSLAFREHAMSLLQTVIALRSLCPHLPLHYGICTSSPRQGSLHLAYYMEAFDCSLDAAPLDVLSDHKDWIALLFQILSALVTVATLLEVAHNDLYPRNVLIKRRAWTDEETLGESTYDMFGNRWIVPWRYLAGLTDFGICSGKALGTPNESPEVERHLQDEIPGQAFGDLPPSVHVLHYRDLPHFSRDPYMLFKWPRFRTRSLPQAPPNVSAWAGHCLSFIDRHRYHFASPLGSRKLLSHAFCPDVLKTFALTPLSIPSIDDTCISRVRLEDRDVVLQDGEALLRSIKFKRS
jgi:serine/threonine protein kinase